MPVTVLENCTGCGRCVAICPVNAISLNPEFANGFGQKHATIDAQHCTDCKLCVPVCPYQALRLSPADIDR